MSRSPKQLPILAVALVAALVLPAAAHASGSQVIADCADNSKLDHKYTQRDYADALASLPTDVDEYYDCRGIIQRARFAALRGGQHGGGGGGGGSTPAGPSDGAAPPSTGSDTPAPDADGDVTDPIATAPPATRARYAAAVQAGAAPVILDGRPIAVGDLGSARAHALPAPLRGLVALLAAGGAAALAVSARRWRRRRAAPTAGRPSPR